MTCCGIFEDKENMVDWWAVFGGKLSHALHAIHHLCTCFACANETGSEYSLPVYFHFRFRITSGLNRFRITSVIHIHFRSKPEVVHYCDSFPVFIINFHGR